MYSLNDVSVIQANEISYESTITCNSSNFTALRDRALILMIVGKSNLILQVFTDVYLYNTESQDRVLFRLRFVIVPSRLLALITPHSVLRVKA